MLGLHEHYTSTAGSLSACWHLTMCLVHSGIGPLCALLPCPYSIRCSTPYSISRFCAGLHTANDAGLLPLMRLQWQSHLAVLTPS